MKRYLIDTTVLTAGLFRRKVAVELLTPWIDRREAATSILVYGEIIEYVRSGADFDDRQAELRELLGEIKPYFLTYRIMERYAEIRRQLRRQGPGWIGDVDTLIAATAMERDLTIVTTDADFRRVAGLNVQLIDRKSLDERG